MELLPKDFGSCKISFKIDGLKRDDLAFVIPYPIYDVVNVQLAFFLWNTNFRLGKPQNYLQQARDRLN